MMHKKKTRNIFYIIIILYIFAPYSVLSVEREDIKKLRNAGISGETIRIIIQEKILETCAFNVDEIIELKKAGFNSTTIQKILIEGSFLKNSETIIYGKNIKSLKMATISDIIELKNEGLSEDTIKALITYSSKSSSDMERDEAWEMLKNMGIIIEKRKKH